MNAFNIKIQAVFMIVLAQFVPIALGQPANDGEVLLPDSLPIENERMMLDWIVTPKQLNGKILRTFNPIGIKYIGTNGIEGMWSTDFPDNELSSYADFELNISKHGMRLIDIIKNDSRIDHSKSLSMFTYHAYTDDRLETLPVGIFLNKVLGLVSNINRETFLGLNIVAKQIIIPITSLEKFEVNVESDVLYNFVWTPQSMRQNITNIGLFKIPTELTTRGYVALQGWYCNRDYKARFKITAGGVTREYTQQGSQILPPSVEMNDYDVSVKFAPGTVTVIESSTDLKNWFRIWTVPWNAKTNIISLPYDTGSGSIVEPKRFFRAKSQ